jgi:hypothetical protein
VAVWGNETPPKPLLHKEIDVLFFYNGATGTMRTVEVAEDELDSKLDLLVNEMYAQGFSWVPDPADF